jgi:hypothetical protein
MKKGSTLVRIAGSRTWNFITNNWEYVSDVSLEVLNEIGKVVKAVSSSHGNSLSTDKPARGYTLRDRKTGKILKYGETTRGNKRYSQKYLDEHNAVMQFEAKGTKAEMHQWQHDKIKEYKRTHDGERPDLNKSDW